MSEELLAKVVSERNALKAKWEKVSERLAAEKKARAEEVDALKAQLAEAQKREFEARVDAMTWKADIGRHVAQRNLLRVHAAKLEEEIQRLRETAATIVD
jgi:hypothetical protein